jgi:hypothetical protein
MASKFMTAILVVAATIGAIGLVQATPASAAHKPGHSTGGGQDNHVEVTICHATNSHTNPYTVNKIDDSSIDEENNKYLNGHGDHTGPVWHQGIADHSWGDIIPPFTNSAGSSFPGRNWTTLGQAIYNNDCKIPEEANITFKVDCDRQDRVRVILKNSGTAAGEITVNGTVHELAAGERKVVRFDDGTQVVIVLNGQTVYNEVVTCNEGEVLTPNISYSYVCDTVTETFKLTLTNSGNANGTVVFNGEDVTVPAGDSVNLSVPAGNSGAKITLVVDGKTVLDQTFVCVQGRGNVPTTPVTPGAGVGAVESLPVTSGASDQVAAIVVMIASMLATAGGYALRARTGLSI